MTNNSESDRLWARLLAAIKRRRFAQDELIEILHEAQRSYGHLNRALLRDVASLLKLPPSRVFGVATFYHLFRMQPRRRHECTVCLGTACYIRGAAALRAEAVLAAQARDDLALHESRCIGTCGIAPMVLIDRSASGPETTDSLRRHLRELNSHGSR
jgi:bidirectional [NiFe] hydrogenase diaphorase subunit